MGIPSQRGHLKMSKKMTIRGLRVIDTITSHLLLQGIRRKVTANSEETLKRGRLPQATGARRKIIEMDLARLQVRSCPRFDIIGHQLEHGPVAQRPARKEFSELERVAHNGLTSFCVCF